MRLLALDLGVDFDHIVQNSGEFERNRLLMLEQNKYDNGNPIEPKKGNLDDFQ